jgi:hypothetical protein
VSIAPLWCVLMIMTVRRFSSIFGAILQSRGTSASTPSHLIKIQQPLI